MAKDHKQEAQWAQKRVWMLVFVFCGFIENFFTKFLFHTNNLSCQKLWNVAFYIFAL